MRALIAAAVPLALTVVVVVAAEPWPVTAKSDRRLTTCPPAEAAQASSAAGHAPARRGGVDWRGLVPAVLGSIMR